MHSIWTRLKVCCLVKGEFHFPKFEISFHFIVTSSYRKLPARGNSSVVENKLSTLQYPYLGPGPIVKYMVFNKLYRILPV